MNRPKSHNITAFWLFIAMVFVVSTTEVHAQSARSRAMVGRLSVCPTWVSDLLQPAGLSQIQGREASFNQK